MNYLGIEANVQNLPELDSSFPALLSSITPFLHRRKSPSALPWSAAAVRWHRFARSCTVPDRLEADRYYIRRLVKSILWMKGGWRVYISGDHDIYDYIRECFSADGCQAFDWDYFSNIYERPFEVVYTDTLPEAKDSPRPAGGHFNGCRIGFDAGGSDRVFRGGCVVSQDDSGPGLPLRRHRRRAPDGGRAYAARGRGGRVERRRIHQ